MRKDPKLGEAIHEKLKTLGLETPIHKTQDKDPHATICDSTFRIMRALGLDMGDDSLMDTPQRVAKMYTQEVFYGLDYNNFPACTTVQNKMKYEEMIAGKASVISMCEHHFVPFIGICWFTYIPKTKVLGLSKFNRVVDFFSRRPQIQERLTEQLYVALSMIVDTPDVAVVVKAKHFCVHIRGVKDQESETITSKVMGKYREVPALRQEFLALTRGE